MKRSHVLVLKTLLMVEVPKAAWESKLDKVWSMRLLMQYLNEQFDSEVYTPRKVETAFAIFKREFDLKYKNGTWSLDCVKAYKFARAHEYDREAGELWKEVAAYLEKFQPPMSEYEKLLQQLIGFEKKTRMEVLKDGKPHE